MKTPLKFHIERCHPLHASLFTVPIKIGVNGYNLFCRTLCDIVAVELHLNFHSTCLRTISALLSELWENQYLLPKVLQTWYEICF